MPDQPKDIRKTTVSTKAAPASYYQEELSRLQKLYHSNCLFSKSPPVPGLNFEFHEDGILVATAVFTDSHQSYDGRGHGGLVAAIIDASMTQCLMGHSVIAYTVDLSIRYHEPVKLNKKTVFETRIKEEKRQKIYMMECLVKQGQQLKAKGTARFFGEIKDRHTQ